MSSSWLDLQNDLRSGITSFVTPSQSTSCGVGGQSTTDSINDIDFLDIAEETQGVSDALSNIQSEIDNFGSEVMGVLQDIGAWIPSGLESEETELTETATQNPYSSFTTCTDVKQTNINSEVCIVDGKNEYGEGLWMICKSDGSHISLDESGSVNIKAVKVPDDNSDGGQMRFISEGSQLFNIGEMMSIQINNSRNYKGGKAFSLIVNGNVDIECLQGDVGISSAGNVKISAGKTLDLTGADIKIHAGRAPATAGTSTEEVTCGGSLDMRCGAYKLSYDTKQGVELTNFTKSDGEIAVIMNSPQGNFGIQSAGSLSINTAGDMTEQIGGRKLTAVFSKSQAAAAVVAASPLSSIFKGISAGYYITNGSPITPATGTSTQLTPPLVHIDSTNHGFKVSSSGKGDIELYTSNGNYSISNSSSAVAGFTTVPTKLDPKTSSAALAGIKKPGTYITSLKQKIDIVSTQGVLISADKIASSTPVRGTGNFVNVTQTSTTVSNKARIYLN